MGFNLKKFFSIKGLSRAGRRLIDIGGGLVGIDMEALRKEFRDEGFSDEQTDLLIDEFINEINTDRENAGLAPIVPTSGTIGTTILTDPNAPITQSVSFDFLNDPTTRTILIGLVIAVIAAILIPRILKR